MKKLSIQKYLIEFVLVFAAIVLGFFAENVREYFSDKAHEKEFILSLAENLKGDSVVFAKRDSALRERMVWMDTLISLITSQPEGRNAEAYLLARYATRIIQSRPGLRTLNFLSKSKDYTSIEGAKVKNQIQEYESELTWLKGLVDLEEIQGQDLWSLVPTVFDTRVFLKMKQYGNHYMQFEKPKGNPKFLSHDPIIINQLTYYLYLRRSQFYSELLSLRRIEGKRQKLVSFLEEKYQ